MPKSGISPATPPTHTHTRSRACACAHTAQTTVRNFYFLQSQSRVRNSCQTSRRDNTSYTRRRWSCTRCSEGVLIVNPDAVPSVLDTDLSLESQFVSLLHVSEEIIKATLRSNSPWVSPNAAATQLPCVGGGGLGGVGKAGSPSSLRAAWVNSASQGWALSVPGEERRKPPPAPITLRKRTR